MNNKFAKQILQNLHYVVLGILLVMLGVVYWLQSREVQMDVPVEPPKAVTTPQAIVPDATVLERLAPKPPIEKTRIGAVRVFDMFDRQAVQDIKAREEEANKIFAEASALHAQGKLKEALAKIDDIFKVYPPHLQAKELKKTIEKEMAAAAGAAAVPGTATPAAATPAPVAPTPAV